MSRPWMSGSRRTKSATLDDVKAFHRQFVGASSAELSIVGDFDEQAVRTLAERREGRSRDRGRIAARTQGRLCAGRSRERQEGMGAVAGGEPLAGSGAGGPRITDFGLSLAAGDAQTVDEIAGTPVYSFTPRSAAARSSQFLRWKSDPRTCEPGRYRRASMTSTMPASSTRRSAVIRRA